MSCRINDLQQGSAGGNRRIGNLTGMKRVIPKTTLVDGTGAIVARSTCELL